MKKMLLVFAHPDDESFAAGGTVAKYARNGWRVELVCVTNGEGRAREAERAGKILGIRQIQFLDQPDGQLQSLTPGTLEDLIVKKTEDFGPDIVITHDTTGMTNHPDHIKVCYATTFAFQKYAKKLEDIQKYPKLYYTCMPASVIMFLQKSKQIPGESHGLPLRGTPDKLVTTVINIKDTKLIKGKALLCYESQKRNVDRYISFDKHPGHNQEWFILRMSQIREVFMGKTDRVSNRL